MNVEQFFADLGWRRFDPAPGKGRALFSLRVDGEGVTNCQCNDRLALHATWYDERIGTHHLRAIEFDITGESKDGTWCVMRVYGINPDDLTPYLVDGIRQRLLRAWEAVQP